MRILIVSQYYWPEQFRINDLAECLVDRGHQVTVLTGSPNYPGGQYFEGYGFFNKPESHHGVKILRVPLVPRGSSSSLLLAINYLSFLVSSTLLGPLICRASFDVIFVCQLSPVTVAIPAILLKRLHRLPLIMWVLDLWPESVAAVGKSRRPWIYRRLDQTVRFIYRHCDQILFTSKGFSSSIQSRGVLPSRLAYFPNWVEPFSESSAPLPVQLPEGFKVLFAGNVGEAQDFATILETAERVREHCTIHWIVLGEGRQLAWVKEQAEARGLTSCFHLLGRFPSDYMPQFFAQADALLVTLKHDPVFAMTVPGKIPSYMSCGRPILAALDGEGANLIRDARAGFAVPSGDAEGLAKAVLALSRMSEKERGRFGAAAKRYCDEHFDREKLFDKLELTMSTVIEVHSAQNNNN